MREMNRNLAIAFALLISLGYPAKSGAVDFAPPKSYPVGTSPSGVVVGDFNGDGKPDIAVANSGSNNVSILLGNGDGTFQPAVNFDAGLSPGSVAIGDFNGDGKLDLALFQAGDTINATAGAISILLGNGDGRFQTPITTALTVLASAMAVADFNVDKKSDLAVSNVDRTTNDGTVSIFLVKGDGTFQPAQTFSIPTGGIGAFAVADFNNDTKPDFAIGGGSGGITIFLGNGDGSFQQAPGTSATPRFPPVSILAGDFRGSGKQDLIVEWARISRPSQNCHDLCITTSQGQISIFLGNGDGSFQGEQIIAFQFRIGEGRTIDDAAIGDFNGDGRPDVAYRRTTGPFNPLIPRGSFREILLGRGDGAFSSRIVLRDSNLIAITSDPGLVLAADNVNADKLSDLVAVGSSNDIAVLLNTSPASGADLSISGSGVSSDPVEIGTNLTYTADVFNGGPEDATGVTFTDTLPNGVSFVSATATQGSCIQSHGIVSCNIGALASPFDAQVTIMATPTVSGTMTNSMEVAANEPDLVNANNSATQTTTVVPFYRLTVTKTGNGSGTVSISHGFISCGSSCSATYPSGTVLSLNQAADSGSLFQSWGGACSGNGSCSVTMNSDQSVTATFTVPPDFTPTPAAMSLTMNRGGQVTDVLTFPAQGGFSGTIALTCSVSGPSPMPTCGISPASVAPGTSATLIVNAAALSASLTAPWFEQGTRLYASWLPLGLLGCVLTTSFDKKRRRHWALCLFMLVATIVPLGCSSGSSTPIKGPPPQNYTVTVTATSGALQHSTPVSVTVN